MITCAAFTMHRTRVDLPSTVDVVMVGTTLGADIGAT